MLDFDTAVAESVNLAHVGPSVVSLELEAQKSTKISNHIETMEADFHNQREATATWVLRAWNLLYRLEGDMADGEQEVSQNHIAGLLEAAEGFSEASEEIAKWAARGVSSFRKSGRQANRVSKELSEFVLKYAKRVERATERDIVVALEISDHYRALARAYDPENSKSEAFEDIGSLMRDLKSD